jgi:hypothetical protein
MPSPRRHARQQPTGAAPLTRLGEVCENFVKVLRRGSVVHIAVG